MDLVIEIYTHLMNHNSVHEWAKSRFDEAERTIGYANFTIDHLEKNYTQVLFYEVASLSKFLYSCQINIAIKCQTPEAASRCNDHLDYTNVGFKSCRSKFDKEAAKNIMDELDRVTAFASSMKRKMQEMIDLQELPAK